jgi:metal-responsive CopG/Arc/MetJ family transcriptional regulator
MKEILVNISVNIPEIYLKELDKLIKLGLVKNKSQFVRDAMEHYLDKDTKLIAIFKHTRRIKE